LESIGNLTSLLNFNISSNNFETFPVEIQNLINLTHLNLSFNKISSIPNQIGNSFLVKLLFKEKMIFFQLNNEMIGQLFKLEVLDGSYNQINKFPDFLSKLNHIKEMNLEGFFLGFWEYNK